MDLSIEECVFISAQRLSGTHCISLGLTGYRTQIPWSSSKQPSHYTKQVPMQNMIKERRIRPTHAQGSSGFFISSFQILAGTRWRNG
jgi:hypothetical protein